jgi:hypothetical protein
VTGKPGQCEPPEWHDVIVTVAGLPLQQPPAAMKLLASSPLTLHGRTGSRGAGDRMRRPIMLAACVALTLSACSGAGSASATGPSPASSPAESTLPSPTASVASATAITSIWSHVGKFFNKPQVWYVARVVNNGNSLASLAIDARALDNSETIVGFSQGVLPNVPPRSRFDYFGYIGGGGAFNQPLTGTPAKVRLSEATDAFGQAGGVWAPLLKTTAVRLTPGTSADTNTDAPFGYNLSVVVENSTDQEIDAEVTQQVVLYDGDGNVVGGDTGASDNKPPKLAPGERYREEWTGIPAVRRATSVHYSVWPGG